MPSIKGEDGPLDRSSKKSLKKSRSKICKYNYKNPYFNFLFEFRTLPENKSLSAKQIFKLAGSKWKEFTAEQRQPYIDAAKGSTGGKKDNVENVNVNKGGPNMKGPSKSIQRNSKGQFIGKYKKPAKANIRRPRAMSVCSECGHRRGSYDLSSRGRLYDNDKDQSDSKSLSSISASTDSRSSTKSGTTRSQSRTTAFDSDASSITTF